ncbi:MAG: amino acid ABC transporter permease [Chloroflexi bacterium]|jgi:general L-amino acid transport system permease protein|nr:amino acid ABC transporter permease [Chloroflexota bacterium]MBT3669761.1 amino acid ABC transporter permease [Chloroflexota bacterium]MBT4002768.1 amino acid ABC transporter permease [Chloroflexota bacterium]MBT4305241.1 amino acid ABC transporter permease [Chloroflexota bacterium]MBT4534836.1 amino acid ABC transporter permease [Chloroflexota bacterium]
MSINTNPQVLPPPDPPGPIKWLKDNLFGNLFNSILTIFSLLIVYFLLGGVIEWFFNTADWRPVTKAPLLYVIGSYPREEMWRVGLSVTVVFFLLGISWGKWGGLLKSVSLALGGIFFVLAILPVKHVQLDVAMRTYLGITVFVMALGYILGRAEKLKPNLIYILWLISPIIIVVLFAGIENSEVLKQVATTSWGGLMVTFLLAIGGILISFPIGVALALGRRSTLPIVSASSTIFIETIRGVPLITILFMFSIILGLFLPADARLDRLLRALMAVTVFSSAYTAENIRGGLQSISKGQYEAAHALGMNNFQTMFFIVLPQAIKVVIPAIVGQFISLFKDTTLVVIVGINDLLGIGRSVINSESDFLQLQLEVYIFIALIYWVFSYFMSVASRRVEASLGVSN